MDPECSYVLFVGVKAPWKPICGTTEVNSSRRLRDEWTWRARPRQICCDTKIWRGDSKMPRTLPCIKRIQSKLQPGLASC